MNPWQNRKAPQNRIRILPIIKYKRFECESSRVFLKNKIRG